MLEIEKRHRYPTIRNRQPCGLTVKTRLGDMRKHLPTNTNYRLILVKNHKTCLLLNQLALNHRNFQLPFYKQLKYCTFYEIKFHIAFIFSTSTFKKKFSVSFSPSLFVFSCMLSFFCCQFLFQNHLYNYTCIS